MSAGEIAGLIAAGALVLLVVLMAVPLLKLGRTLDETTLTIRQAREQSAPILSQANTTVTRVNSNLERVDDIAQRSRCGIPDLVRVVLDQTRRREVLGELAVRGDDGAPVVVERDRSHTGGPGVDREDAHGRAARTMSRIFSSIQVSSGETLIS